MTDEVRSEVIKKTQDSLAKFIKKPSLTEKLLKKPPFRFLHDVTTNVIRDTSFLTGLYTEHELDSKNITDRESKVAFLQKLIDALKTTGLNVTARPSKIVAGLEPTKTNELLQAIGYALENKLDISKTTEQPAKTKSKTKDESKSKTSDKTLKKQPSKNVTTKKISDKKSDEKKSTTKVKSSPRTETKTETSKTKQDSDRHSDRKTEREKIKKEKAIKTEPEIKPEIIKTEEISDTQSVVEEEKIKTEEIMKEIEPMPVAEEIEKVDSIKPVQIDEMPKAIQPSVADERKIETVQQFSEKPEVIRPLSSLRPPSVRPSSARPGAPRLKDRSELLLPNDELVPMGKVNVIIENFENDKNLNQDEEETVIMENIDENPPEEIIPVAEIPAEKGHLVSQILEQLVTTHTEIEWDTRNKRDREIASREMEKLRDLIQTLTRAANPLGKLMNFLQEDVDSMQSELVTWIEANDKLGKQIEEQESSNEETLRPLREQLDRLEQDVVKQRNMIATTQATVLRNGDRIYELLNKRE